MLHILKNVGLKPLTNDLRSGPGNTLARHLPRRTSAIETNITTAEDSRIRTTMLEKRALAVDKTVPTIQALILLDNEGKRIAVDYFSEKLYVETEGYSSGH